MNTRTKIAAKLIYMTNQTTTTGKKSELGEALYNLKQTLRHLNAIEYHIAERLRRKEVRENETLRNSLIEIKDRARQIRQELAQRIFKERGINKEDAAFFWCFYKHISQALENFTEYWQKYNKWTDILSAIDDLERRIWNYFVEKKIHVTSEEEAGGEQLNKGNK